MHFFHYGELEHIEAFFRDGSIQIGTLRAYDTETHGTQIGDDQEGLSFTRLTDDVVARFRSEGREIPPHLDQNFGPGCRGNFVSVTNISFNYAVFCVSRVLHRELCTSFKPSYNAAIYIDRPFPFFAELSSAFEQSGLAESIQFQHVADVDYTSRHVPDLDALECVIKDPSYQYQAETRAIWSAGAEPPKYFRFKAPNAVRCCRMVLLDDMPAYGPGADRAAVDAAMLKAYNSGKAGSI